MKLTLQKGELAEIYNRLNNWEWDYRLGVKPEKWDDMPNFKSKDQYSFLTKTQIITPYMQLIYKIIGEKECLRWHHIHNLGKTNFQFEVYWVKRTFNRILRGGL